MAKTICLRCHGNGYIKVMDSMENQHQIETIYQCPQCNSQGEIMID
jgi:DnaJ-class molecular chaperone